MEKQMSLVVRTGPEKETQEVWQVQIVLPKCPVCGGEWKHYDGLCGYESLVCSNEECRLDINDVKIVVK